VIASGVVAGVTGQDRDVFVLLKNYRCRTYISYERSAARSVVYWRAGNALETSRASLLMNVLRM